jgi:hypothetical protein
MNFIPLTLFFALRIAAVGDNYKPPVTPSCRTSADTAANFVKVVQRTLAIGDSTKLAGIGLLPAQPSQVFLITTDSLCTAAVTAYNTSLPTVTAVTTIFLLQAGPNRYVAFDPAARSGEFVDLLIFDLSFAFKGQIEG